MTRSIIDKDNLIRTRVNFHSSERTSGTSSNFTIPMNILRNNLIMPKFLALNQIDLVNGFNNIQPNANQLRVVVRDSNGVTYPVVASVPTSNYTAARLITVLNTNVNTAIQTAVSTAGANALTFTLDQYTNYLTITMNVASWAFYVDTSLQQLDYTIGMKTQQPFALQIIGDSAVDARPYPVVSFNTNLVSTGAMSPTGQNANCMQMVQMNVNYGGTAYYKSSNPLDSVFVAAPDVSAARFWLADEYGNPITMTSNQDFSFSFDFWH